MRHFAWLALACGLATSSPADGQAFSVEDLLSLEELGRTAFSPDGRWLVFEIQGPWKSAPRFDQDFLIGAAASRLMLLDLTDRGPARALLRGLAGDGETFGAFSPDGARLIVFRQRGHARELGVVTLASGAVAWSGRLVEPELWFAQARWRDNREVVAISRPLEAQARLAGLGWLAGERLQQAWAAGARGEISVTALGSGRFSGVNAPASTASLVAIDGVSGAVRDLTQGAFSDLMVAPGGRTAALIEDGERTQPSTSSTMRVGYPPRRLRLVMVDLVSGKRTIPCPRCDLIRGTWTWSPKGDAVAVAARPDGDGWSGYGYWRLAANGTAKPLAPDLTLGDTGGRDPRPMPGLAWLGRDPFVLARGGGTPRQDWWRLDGRRAVKLTGTIAEPQGPAVMITARGFVIRSAEGLQRIGADGRLARFAPSTASLDAPADLLPGEPRATRMLSQDGERRLLGSNGERSAPLDLPAKAQILAASQAWGGVAVTTTDPHGVGSLQVIRPGAPARAVATINSALADKAFATPEAIRHRGLVEAELTSWLYLPPVLPTAGLKGLIVVPYPGARYARPPVAAEPGSRSFDTNVQLMVAAGYAVIVPSLPMARDREPMPGLAEAMLLAVDAAIATHPVLKDKPLAVWGQSYGGYGALAAGVQSSRFSAIVASAPITNLLSYYGAIHPEALASPALITMPSELGWAENGQGAMGGPPWSAPDKYLRNSPGLQSDKIGAPVLLIYGDLDMDLGQVTTLFSSLLRQGKDAQLLLYRGESHVVMSPGNVRDLYARVFAFLDAALPGSALAPATPGGAPTPATVSPSPSAMRPSQ
ncbi:prolyl oligopeptidase family serine peptidase [Caulobacter sp. CCH9-E1]|jgi:dipeptidyl aminopeptidase/acylaminoacyl peptidase|uniref:S9 family peptidase n=1 Tax=unclassified Caulobacter TaxID=2648921 RepID=UPI0007844F32|nr:prolyl oligopeptidase family serine peptidase [Caulobacter sp. CCH9-E1]AZS21753.1 S9 family peptidase [Caulobacter sp. FWC26]